MAPSQHVSSTSFAAVIETGQGAFPRGLAGAVCVVTGGYGFIGSNLVHALVRAGATVRIVDALIPSHGGHRCNIDSLTVQALETSIADPAVADVVTGADLVFNLAGQVSHTASMRDPQRDLRLNALDHAEFLETIRRVNPTVRVVHASTRQVYGKVSRLPVDETTAANPVDVNGVAKLAGEQLHLVYSQAYGMSTTSLRLSNVYGPRQRLSTDDLGFLPVFVRKVLLGETIQLFGDGLQRRDCLHVDDVVAAFIAATADDAIGRVYNVGHSVDATLAEIAEIMVDLAASGGGVEYTPWPADHERIAIGSFKTDSSLIGRELGWSSTIDLTAGIANTIDFYRSHPWYLSST